MRIGVVRDDMGHGLHLDDFLPRNQYPYDSQVAGQARTIRKPSDEKLLAVVSSFPIAVAILGSNTAVSVNTSSNNTLRIRMSKNEAYTVITVTSGATTAKTVIVSDLNAAFVTNSLDLIASIFGTNQLKISSSSTNVGSNALIDIDTIANGSTLSTPVGFSDGATASGTATAVIMKDIKTAVYPTTSTIDVAETTVIAAHADLANLSTLNKVAFTAAIADLVAPKFIETGDVLLSFASGKAASMRVAAFRPGGVRAGLPAAIAIAAVENDGSTPFTYP